jgi:ferredoxin-NADP reductase
VVELVEETAQTRSIALSLAGWSGHRAGQHVDVRLTAEDGYQAQRSYSIASAPEDTDLVLTVERLDDGEVSPYLVDELRPGDRFELRGPIGGYFVWEPRPDESLFLLAGGSGIVPLMAMIRHREADGIAVPARLLYSSRTLDDVIYRAELDELASRRNGLEVSHTLTRAQPPGWNGHARRVDAALIREVAWPPGAGAIAFVCGPTAFVETSATALAELGYPADHIRTERFGPTGT